MSRLPSAQTTRDGVRAASPHAMGWHSGRPRILAALLALVVALTCAATAGWLAAHHPLSPPLAMGACALLALAALSRPAAWPALLLGLLPVAGLMTWTGWVIVEEFDLVLLALAAGAWARLAWDRANRARQQRSGPPSWAWLALLPLAFSTLIAMVRGIGDAGGLQWGWWQGYSEPLNALRLAKPMAGVLLLLPPWFELQRNDPRAARRAVQAGMALALALTTAAVCWERWGFTGLLNFSSDYRATGPFWEMHVGGAALDAALAMTLPFVALQLWRTRSVASWISLALVLGCGFYAALVTFSRIVYLAVPLSLAVMAVLQWRAARSAPASAASDGSLRARGWQIAGVLGYTAAATLTFQALGYRGLLGLWLAAAAIIVIGRHAVQRRPGDGPAPASAALAQARWRRPAAWILALLLVSAVVGVFLGGSYMSQRLHDSAQDGQGRRDHWNRALGLLDGTSDWLLGKGLGRYHAHHGLSGQVQDQTGDYRLLEGDDGPALVLSSGKHLFGGGGVFRLSQRLPAPAELTALAPLPLTLRLRLRTASPVVMRAEVCEKHLLYTGYCADAQRELASTGGSWREISLELKARHRLRPAGWPSRLVSFSIGLDSLGSRAEIDDLELTGLDGRNLLVNGDFQRGLARWYTTSDRNHLPWHAKNQALHLLFEQGWLGLAAFALALVFATRRIWQAATRGDPSAVALGGALIGMLTVGLVDSLMDMPRIAFLSLWLLALALALPRGPSTQT